MRGKLLDTEITNVTLQNSHINCSISKENETMASHANPVNWFEIPVTDMARAIAFYQKVFELELAENEMGPNKMAWFPMEMGASGATGTLIQGDAYTPSHDGSLVYLNVDSIETTLSTINEAGGKTLVPMMNIGDHGSIAHFEDTEGNRVALHQNPEG